MTLFYLQPPLLNYLKCMDETERRDAFLKKSWGAGQGGTLLLEGKSYI